VQFSTRTVESLGLDREQHWYWFWKRWPSNHRHYWQGCSPGPGPGLWRRRIAHPPARDTGVKRLGGTRLAPPPCRRMGFWRANLDIRLSQGPRRRGIPAAIIHLPTNGDSSAGIRVDHTLPCFRRTPIRWWGLHPHGSLLRTCTPLGKRTSSNMPAWVAYLRTAHQRHDSYVMSM